MNKFYIMPKEKYSHQPGWQYVRDILYINHCSVAQFATLAGVCKTGIYRIFLGAGDPSYFHLKVIVKTLEKVDGQSWKIHLIKIVENDYKREARK